jgi:hypothetical protein
LRIKEIEPIFKEEKESPSLVKRPIIVNYYQPQRNDPFGTSICDILEDKEKAKTLLFNLELVKARKEAFGGDYLVNERVIKNPELLSKPTIDSKYISVDPQ